MAGANFGNNKIKVPVNCQASSMVTQIANMKEGHSCSRIIEIADEVTMKEVADNLRNWKRRLTSSTQSSIRYAKTRMGRKADQARFTIETSHFMTQSGRVAISITVTRESDYVDL